MQSFSEYLNKHLNENISVTEKVFLNVAKKSFGSSNVEECLAILKNKDYNKPNFESPFDKDGMKTFFNSIVSQIAKKTSDGYCNAKKVIFENKKGTKIIGINDMFRFIDGLKTDKDIFSSVFDDELGFKKATYSES